MNNEISISKLLKLIIHTQLPICVSSNQIFALNSLIRICRLVSYPWSLWSRINNYTRHSHLHHQPFITPLDLDDSIYDLNISVGRNFDTRKLISKQSFEHVPSVNFRPYCKWLVTSKYLLRRCSCSTLTERLFLFSNYANLGLK